MKSRPLPLSRDKGSDVTNNIKSTRRRVWKKQLTARLSGTNQTRYQTGMHAQRKIAAYEKRLCLMLFIYDVHCENDTGLSTTRLCFS